MSKFNVNFCCTCLKICSEKEKLISLSLKASQEMTYRNKLKSCVPEMILQNTEDCYLCVPCSRALENAYKFRCMCLITENKLQEYRASQQRSFRDICSVREDLLQVLSRELRDLERENPSVVAAKELGCLLSETLIKQESNTALQSIKAEIDTFTLSSQRVSPRKRALSDDDLIRKARRSIPELRNIPDAALRCRVSLEKIVVKELPVIIPSTDDDKKNSKFYCAICDKAIKKKERFYSHMLKHSNIKAYKCDECTAAYFSADSLRYHKKRIHLAPPRLNHTSKINPSFVKKMIVPNVVQKKKTEVKKKKTAVEEKCIFKIKLPPKIKKANSVNESLSDKVFRCKDCDYHTVSKHYYDRHIIKHSGDASYPCALCPKSYSAQWVLNRHIRSSHKITESTPPKKKGKPKMPPPIQIKKETIEDEEMVECTTCNQQFSSEPEYKIHLKTHTDVILAKSNSKATKKKKRFFCTVCNFEFSSRDHANIHTGAKPYTCNVCTKTFAAYTTLRKHRYTHKNDYKKPIAKPSIKHVCEICKKEFQKEAELCAHNCQTSTGESVYRCQICRNAYLGRTALIDHMRVHVGQDVDLIKN